MPFGAYKYRDHVAFVDTGLLNAAVTAQSASTVSTVSSGKPLLMFGSNNFHKVVYRLYAASAGTTAALDVYYWRPGFPGDALSGYSSSYGSGAWASNSSLAATINQLWSTSAYSSVSSYWSQADSANFTVSGSHSTSTTVLTLDFRPEKFSAPWNVVLPVVQVYGASASTVSTNFTVTGDVYLTDFQPASNYDSSTLNVVETDYF